MSTAPLLEDKEVKLCGKIKDHKDEKYLQNGLYNVPSLFPNMKVMYHKAVHYTSKGTQLKS